MNPILLTVLVAMVPVIELRGAIPIGMGMGLEFWTAFFWGVVGNLLPVPFLILFVRRVFAFMKAHWPRLRTLVEKLEERGREKGKALSRYEWLGLLILVAIPLPGTGAWTGTLAASILKLDFKKSIIAVILGVLVAGIIMGMISAGIFGLIRG